MFLVKYVSVDCKIGLYCVLFFIHIDSATGFSLVFLTFFVAIAITISVTIAISVAVTIAVSVAITLAVTITVFTFEWHEFLVVYIVQDDGHVGVGVVAVEFVNAFKQTFVEFAGTYNEQRVVDKVLYYVGVYHQTRRCIVEDDILVLLAQFGNQFVQAATAEQLCRVGRYWTGEQGVDTRTEHVVANQILPVVCLAAEVVAQTSVSTGIELACERALAQVEVEDDHALARNAESGGKVGRDERLAHSRLKRGDHYDLRLAGCAHEVNLGTQQTERLAHRVVVVVGDNQCAVVLLLPGRYFAQERRVGLGHDIVVELHLGVEQHSQEEYADRYQQSYDQAVHGTLLLVGCYWGAVDACGVQNLAVGLD